jgi:hypothetical protein
MKLLLVIAVFSLAKCACSYKILGVFPLGSPSHYAIGESTLKALAEAGHEVTMISVMKTKKPVNNFKEIIIPDSMKLAMGGNQET